MVNNPTAIHINVIDVAVDGKPLDLAMIKPFETLNIPLPAGVASKTLTWHSINDYGAISDVIKYPFDSGEMVNVEAHLFYVIPGVAVGQRHVFRARCW